VDQYDRTDMLLWVLDRAAEIECHLVTCHHPSSRDAHPGPVNRPLQHLTTKEAAAYGGCLCYCEEWIQWDRISLTRIWACLDVVHFFSMALLPFLGRSQYSPSIIFALY
jgi:hypothetical protein